MTTPEMMTTGDDAPRQLPDTANEYLLGYGKNLPNHSESLRGRAGFIRQQVAGLPTFRTREAAFRYVAWLITMAETTLPPEDLDTPYTFAEVLDAIRNT